MQTSIETRPKSLLTSFWHRIWPNPIRQLVMDEETALVWFASQYGSGWKRYLTARWGDGRGIPETVDGVEIRNLLLYLRDDPNFGLEGLKRYKGADQVPRTTRGDE